MIRALTKIKEYLGKELETQDVALCAINKDGAQEEGNIIITLVHIEEEASRKQQIPSFSIGNDGLKTDRRYTQPEIALNLYVLISAHNDKYDAAITNISKVIHAFQKQNIFEYPSLSNKNENDSIRMTLHPFTLEQNINLWQSIGYKMMPSVMYKVSLILVQDSESQPDANVEKVITNYPNQVTSTVTYKNEEDGEFVMKCELYNRYSFKLDITHRKSDNKVESIKATALFSLPENGSEKYLSICDDMNKMIQQMYPQSINGKYKIVIEQGEIEQIKKQKTN